MLSVHAPTLLVTQRVWGTDPWEKIDRSIALADELGADTVVLHPPFRWQRDYARDFVDGVALRENDTHIGLAVENMYPWRGPRSRELEAYLPALGPGAAALRPRHPRPVAHLDLGVRRDGDGATGSGRGCATCTSPTASGRRATSTSCPGAAPSRAARCSRHLPRSGYAGHVVVEVATRRAGETQRELDLAEALAFARLHLATIGVRRRPGAEPSVGATGGQTQ